MISSYAQEGVFVEEFEDVYNHYKDAEVVHYFNTTGILQHNGIGPQCHITTVRCVKVSSHLM